MMEYLAASLIIVSLFMYAVLLSIECGATLFIAAPGLLGDENIVRAYISPAWETTNVFLVTAFVSLIAFFPGALPLWSNALIVPFLVFLLVMGVRVLGMLYVFYKGGENRAIKIMLAIASLSAPAVLAGGILPFFVTGVMPYGPSEWLLAIVFGIVALASVTLISSSFFHYLRKRATPSVHLVTFVRFSLIFFLLATFGSVFLFSIVTPRIAVGMVTVLPLFALLAIINLAFMFDRQERYRGARFILAVALFAAFFFGFMFSQLPYIIYPTMTLFAAFTDPASASIMLGAFGVALIFLIPALGLLYYLFAVKK